MNRSVSTLTGKIKMKIVLLGQQAVGKSSIIEKYIKDRFDESSNPTVGVDFLAKNISHRSRMYRLQLWDTAGQQRFRSLIPSYLKDANCAIIVFDVTSRASLAAVDSWLALFNENKSTAGCIVLVANKVDLDYREVTFQEGAAKAKELNVAYFEISAKTGQNVEEMFLRIVDIINQPNAPVPLAKCEETYQEGIKEEDEKKDQSMAMCIKGKKEGQHNIEEESKTVVLKNYALPPKQNKKACC